MFELFFFIYLSLIPIATLLFVSKSNIVGELNSINENIKSIVYILKEDMCPNTFRHSFNSFNEPRPFIDTGNISPLSFSLPSLTSYSPRSSDGLIFDPPV
jgi:hypothetical protein